MNIVTDLRAHTWARISCKIQDQTRCAIFSYGRQTMVELSRILGEIELRVCAEHDWWLA